MAARRMFSKRLTESTKFLKMPATSQNLYFHLGMNADDDGVVEALLVMRTVGATEDDLRVIVSKGFATVLNEDMVTYLNDWRENNNIRADRKIDSIYKELLLSIVPDISLVEAKTSYYSRKKAICQTNDGQVTDVCPPRLGKDSLDKNRLDNNITSNVILSGAETAPAPNTTPDASGILLSLVDKTDYDVPLSKIEEWKEAYPAVDIEQELKKMSAWLNANPSRKKTRRGINRFINTWLSREQDKGGRYRVSNYNGQNGGNGISEAARHEAEQRAAYGKY